MRKLNELEMFGGKATIFSAKVDKPEIPLVTPDMNEVKSKRVGESSKTIYLDPTGKEWDKSQLGYKVPVRNKEGQTEYKFVTKLPKTDKVVRYEIEEKTRYIGNFWGDSRYVVEPDAVAEAKLRELGVYDDKVMTFTYKKVDNGKEYHRAVLFLFQGELCMETSEKPAFWSDFIAGYKAEKAERLALKAALQDANTEIVIKAEEIEVIV